VVGIVAGIVVVYIFFLFWKNSEIDLKWKIILTILAIACRIIFSGLVAIISSVVVMIIIFFMLRWYGEKIR